MHRGTRRLAKSTAAYAACVSFAVVYLLATWVGSTGTTALTRGSIAAVFVYFLGRLLFYPLVDTVLAAVADAEQERQEAEE